MAPHNCGFWCRSFSTCIVRTNLREMAPY